MVVYFQLNVKKGQFEVTDVGCELERWIKIEEFHAKRTYIEFWPIFIFCKIKLIFGRLTCSAMKSIVP